MVTFTTEDDLKVTVSDSHEMIVRNETTGLLEKKLTVNIKVGDVFYKLKPNKNPMPGVICD
jgi:hypothetical protein